MTMKLSDVTHKLRVRVADLDTYEEIHGTAIDTNPESATDHEVLVQWDHGKEQWVSASELEPE